LQLRQLVGTRMHIHRYPPFLPEDTVLALKLTEQY
jgi:hypothetical protein